MQKPKLEIKAIRGSWASIYRSTMNTVGLDRENVEPSSQWKRRILLSEHSPIRKLNIEAKWTNLMYWVSVHLVRHKFGIEHFVSTQRDDRQKIETNRNEAPQGALVSHEIDANAQAIITISRKRLCTCASPETRQAWKLFVKSLEQVEPELASVCVPDCVYRGHCYEFKTCGYHKTEAFKKALAEYRKGINE